VEGTSPTSLTDQKKVPGGGGGGAKGVIRKSPTRKKVENGPESKVY